MIGASDGSINSVGILTSLWVISRDVALYLECFTVSYLVNPWIPLYLSSKELQMKTP